MTVAEDAADQVIDILLALPKIDNPRVYDDILAIALRLNGKGSSRLLPKVLEYTELDNQFLTHRYPELLQYWAAQGNVNEALEVVKRLVPFREDRRAKEKRLLRKKSPNAFGSMLEPAPRFDQWEYQQILENGVRPLAEREPYQVARILIDAVSSMIRLGMHAEDFDKARDEDYSELWCVRLDKADSDHREVKASLVHTLTHACEQVYERTPESIDALDQALRNQRWKVFKRLRQLLFASYPNDKTLPWIRDLIIDHSDYPKWDHDFEFQLMIRISSEHFGLRLLSEAERSTIFDAILSGPSEEDFRESMGERYTDENFQKRRRYFHHLQFRPFSELLDGEYRRYFDELENELQTEQINDDSYSPFMMGESGFVTFQSPKSLEELEGLADEDLLAYLNDWEEQRRERDNFLVEINITALANEFQAFFKKNIVPDGKRLSYWMVQRDKILRPIYISKLVKAMQDLVKEKSFGNLDQWIDFCAWVLSHSDTERVDGQPEPRDESREKPDWGGSRQAVVDFIDACVDKEINVPLAARGGLANLLRQVCNQADWRLDHDRPVILNRDDQFTEAINNTRSRALQSLVNFGFWIRRYLPEDSVPEVTDILSNRIISGADFPLVRPERALLGMQFGNLCALNRDWAISQKGVLFPQGDLSVWRDAFSSYIRFNRPVKMTFEILRSDFEFALDNLNVLTAANDEGKEIVDRLGQHFFTYYLWEIYPLQGVDSLLARFYDKTSDDRKRWTHLFDHVGRALKSSGKNLKKELADRAIAFFDWRLEVAEPLELQEFTFWLDAECLTPEWRLHSYSKVLDIERGKDVSLSLEVKTLNKLLPHHLPLVVECFAKVTDALSQGGTQMYILADEAKPILRAGLNSGDPQVRKNAERARENLLRVGRFDFLDLEQ